MEKESKKNVSGDAEQERLMSEVRGRFEEEKSYIADRSPNYKRTEILVIAIFWGILASFAVISFVGLLMGYRKSEDYFSEMPQTHPFVREFNDTLFRNKDISDNIVKNEYILFKRVLNNNVIAGKNNYLFEIERKDNGYNYLLDYTDGNVYTNAELKKITDNLETRRQKYLDHDCQYMLVVIPSNYTACSEYLPDYINRSENPTRLMQLSQYMSENSDVLYLDLSDKMYGEKNEFLYNNTEDSINTLGAWYIYNAIYRSLDPEYKEYSTYLPKDTYTVYKRITEGGRIAQEAGLSDVVKNVTLSLSGSNNFNYSIREFLDNGAVVTYRSFIEDDGNAHISLLLEFSNERDKALLMPYFSASFDRVAYKVGHEFSKKNVGNTVPNVTVQFIHEYELDMLMSDIINDTYKSP